MVDLAKLHRGAVAWPERPDPAHVTGAESSRVRSPACDHECLLDGGGALRVDVLLGCESICHEEGS
jgi:hypothetical protein